MRHFRRTDVKDPEAEYDCQDDGMVGLGCGARSYTRSLHYSFDYAVSVRGVRAVLEDYLGRGEFGYAEVGIELDAEEQRRRRLVKSLLQAEGVPAALYEDELAPLRERGWLHEGRLTDEGLERSDAIGPWLVSPAVRERMGEYALR